MSETAASRDILAPWCIGIGLDLGFGGDPVVPSAITFDLPGGSYGAVGSARQIMRGDCRDLSMFCDNALDYVYSSHLIEDWHYSEQLQIVREWRRVLRPGGLLITNCPHQKRFEDHCLRTGQGLNMNHKEPTMSFETFQQFVIDMSGPWKAELAIPEHGAYSWLSIHRKMVE